MSITIMRAAGSPLPFSKVISAIKAQKFRIKNSEDIIKLGRNGSFFKINESQVKNDLTANFARLLANLDGNISDFKIEPVYNGDLIGTENIDDGGSEFVTFLDVTVTFTSDGLNPNDVDVFLNISDSVEDFEGSNGWVRKGNSWKTRVAATAFLEWDYSKM